MSAWSEAVWIVNQMNNRFDFQQLVNEYTSAIANNMALIQSYYQDVINSKEIQIVEKEPSEAPSSGLVGTVYLIAR